MELINNRYRLDCISGNMINGTVYKAVDLFNQNNILLKMFNNNIKNNQIIDYFIKNFNEMSDIEHKYICSSYSFNIVERIDNNKVANDIYFYTKEFINYKTLKEEIYTLTFNQKMKIIMQLCEAVDYLHFRGKAYQYLTPENIFIYKSQDGINIKLKDFTYTRELELGGVSDNISRKFIAPEVIANPLQIDYRSDIYSIGMIIYTMISEKNIEQLIKEKGYLISSKFEYLLDGYKEILQNMLQKDINNRYQSIRQALDDINRIKKTNYSIDVKGDREKLHFNLRTISRDEELDFVFKIDNEFANKKFNTNLLTIVGDSGIGKTRFIDEIKFRMKMKSRPVYIVNVTQKNNEQFSIIVEVVRQIIKKCDPELIDKYGSELVKIIPELRNIKNIKPSSVLPEDKEKLRLYDRITNFISDYAKNNFAYIIFDDFHLCDNETVEIINYIIENIKDCPLLIVLAFNKYLISDNDKLKNKYYSWENLSNTKVLELTKFNIKETSELVQKILGIGYMPVNFSARIFKETGGNPRYIEEVIKNLFVNGELYINDNGYWDSKTHIETNSYSSINIPSTIGDAIKEQIKIIDDKSYDIITNLSIFNTSVSKGTIKKLLNIEEKITSRLIDKLVSMKILDERVGDWGYTYDFHNINMKKYIYNIISYQDKLNLHKKAAGILESLFTKENRENLDELIYHFTQSNQIEKAIDYSIKSAKKMQDMLINSQAIALWEKAKRLFGEQVSIKKIDVIINLAKLYSMQGSNDKALDLYDEAMRIAVELNQSKYMVICKNNIGQIFIRRNQIYEAEVYIKDAKTIAEEINYVNGCLNSVIILNRISLGEGNCENILKLSAKYLELAKRENKYEHIAHLLNQIGVAWLLLGKINKAKRYFENSIVYFDKSENSIEITKPINNLGLIYSEYNDNTDKAMEYFQKGLEISRKYDSMDNMVNLLNNIGEMYIRKDEYEKAKDYMEKVVEIAKDIEEESVVFLSRINMAMIYLNMGVYDRCFKYFNLIKKERDTKNFQWQELNRYYEFLREFYYKFGLWDNVLEVCYKIKNNYSEIDTKHHLSAESTILLVNYYKNKYLDKEKINLIRNQYRESDLIRDRRNYLLKFAHIALDSGENQYAKELLKEDEKLIQKFNTNYIKLIRDYITIDFYKKDIEDIKHILKNACKLNLPIIEMYLYSKLGERYEQKMEYYHAANYYITALDIMERLLRKIKLKNIRSNFAEVYNINQIFNKLKKIKNIILNHSNNYEVAATKQCSYEDIIDCNEILEIYENDDFIRATYDQYTLSDITTIKDLIRSFTDDYTDNLNIILKYAIRETLGERGYIAILNSEEERYELMVSTENINRKVQIEQIAFSDKKTEGILVKSTIRGKCDEINLFSDEETKSYIYMPIMRFKQNLNTSSKKRRKIDNINTNEIIGYIYLESDKLFNRFDENSF